MGLCGWRSSPQDNRGYGWAVGAVSEDADGGGSTVQKVEREDSECHSRTRNTTQEQGPDMASQYKEMGDVMTQTVLMMDVMYVQFLLKI